MQRGTVAVAVAVTIMFTVTATFMFTATVTFTFAVAVMVQRRHTEEWTLETGDWRGRGAHLAGFSIHEEKRRLATSRLQSTYLMEP